MTGFLFTAKQKLMLCINKRLYWSYRPDWRYGYRRDWPHGRNRTYWSYWPDRRYWSYGSHGCNR